MKIFFVTLAFFSVLILTATAHAENLIELDFRDNFGDLHYIDSDSVSKYKRGMFYATFQTSYSDESLHRLGNHNVDYKISRYAFAKKGNDKYFSIVYSKFCDVRGAQIKSDEDVSKWEKIMPESLEEVMYETALKYLK